MDLRVFIKKRLAREILLLFLIALILEIFLFNNRSFSTAGYNECILDDSYSVKMEGESLNGNGDIVMDEGAESVTLEIDGFGYPLNNIMIDVECMDDTVTSAAIDHVCIVEGTSFDDAILELIDDEKNSNLVYGTIMSFKNDVLHTVPDSQYIYLKLYFSLYNTVIFDTDCITMGKRKKAAVILFSIAFASFFVMWHLICGGLEWNIFWKILLGLIMAILIGSLLLMTIKKHYRSISFASFMLMWGRR